MLGLVRGTVEIYDHDKTWEENATQTIDKLKAIFGSVATDIQHVGSTSIIQIKAKPIIDIAVAVNSYDDVYALVPYLKQVGFIHSPKNDIEPTELQSGQIFFICVGEK